MSRLILLPGVCEPGASEWLEGLAAQARQVRRAAGDEIAPTLLSALIDLEHQLETQAALIGADEILAGAEVA